MAARAAAQTVARHRSRQGHVLHVERWPAFTRSIDDGRNCLSKNTAERTLCGIALDRKSWLPDRGGQRAVAMYSLIVTARLNKSIRRPGWTMSWPGSPTILPAGSASYCSRTRRRKSESLTMAAIASSSRSPMSAMLLGEEEQEKSMLS
jgi:hypothetical protein